MNCGVITTMVLLWRGDTGLELEAFPCKDAQPYSCMPGECATCTVHVIIFEYNNLPGCGPIHITSFYSFRSQAYYFRSSYTGCVHAHTPPSKYVHTYIPGRPDTVYANLY